MPAILPKNCVVTGEVDSYCLVCCEQLPAERDALAHIQGSSHKHNLSSHGYFQKLPNECIRKVAGVYFCEFCNTVFPTAAKVGLHVTEQAHLERKRRRMLRREGKCIVFHENISVTENVWNGLIGDTCVLCNDEFEDESLHKSEQKHILNLISSKVTIGDNNDIYRQVDGMYHCLSCNKVISTNVILEHLDSAVHKSSLTKLDHKQDNAINTSEECLPDKTADKADANDDSDVATDKCSTESLNDDQYNSLDGKTLYTKPVQMKKEQPSCSISMPADLENFAKQHGLSVIKNDNKVYCKSCTTDIPATLHRVKEHVAGRKHRDKLTKYFEVNKQTTTKLEKRKLIKCLVVTAGFEILNLDLYPETILFLVFNKCLIVNANTFMGVKKFHNRLFCQLCNIEVNPLMKHTHCESSRHADLIKNCYFITSLDGEFVRQLRSDLFDCVYCGCVEHDWEDMLDHLDTDEHKTCKAAHERMLSDYMMARIKDEIRNAMPFNIAALLDHMRLF